MNYVFHILIMINIYIVLTVASNLLTGMTKLLSLAQGAFYGIGAYLTVLCIKTLGLPLGLTLFLVLLISGLISLIVAIPTLKLKGDYFILGTLGFQLITFTILYNWKGATNGPYGISGIPAPKIFGLIEISGLVPFLVLSTILAGLVSGLMYHLMKSPFGRALKALRDNETAALSIGHNVRGLKTWVFVISSAFLGLGGFLFSTYIGFIDPTSFKLDESFFILSAVLIGGVGDNIRGPIVGAIFVILLPEALRFVGLPDSVAANLRQIIYGLFLIVLMFIRPQGLAGNLKIS